MALCDACTDAPAADVDVDIAAGPGPGGLQTTLVPAGKRRTRLHFGGCGVPAAALDGEGSCAPAGGCGDGGRDGEREDCDDGNRFDGDGCGRDCRVEAFCVCGGGALNRGDECACDGGRPFSVAGLAAAGVDATVWWWQGVSTWPAWEAAKLAQTYSMLG